jgi:Tfp pilus assembly protein PilO
METTEQGIQEKINIIEDARSKTYKFAIATLLVVLVLAIGAIQPTAVTITRITTEIDMKKDVNSRLQAKIDALSSLSKDYNAKKIQFDDLKLYFPARGDFSLIMANINEIATKNSFSLKNIGFDAPDKSLPTSVAGFSVLKQWRAVISVSGNKQNLINFLKDLESLPNYPTIESVSFTNSADEHGNMQFSVSMRIYKIENQDFYK